MGWARGSQLAEDIWDTVREFIPKKKRQAVALDIVELFQRMDCDTLDEAERLMKDAGIEPTYYE